MAKEIRQYGSKKPDASANDAPSAEEVEKFHKNADVDVREESYHHTLGTSETQAAKGSHSHDGGNSVLILEGFTITGTQSDGTALPSIIACLVRLGATDSSAP